MKTKSDNLVREIRKEQGLSARELSIKSGVYIETIYKLERGKFSLYKSSFETISKLSKGLNVKPYELFKDITIREQLSGWKGC